MHLVSGNVDYSLLLAVCLCGFSGCVQKPIKQPSSTINAVDIQSDSERSWTMLDGVDCVASAAVLSGIYGSSDVQNVSLSAAVSDCQALLPGTEAEHMPSYEMCASPARTDFLSDIWLSSAAVDLGSPSVLRSCGSGMLIHRST